MVDNHCKNVFDVVNWFIIPFNYPDNAAVIPIASVRRVLFAS